MERIRIYAPALMLLLMAVSCIDKDILNISDSVEINSRYSVPIGTYDTDINNYLESLDTLGPSSGDSLYYEGVLYPINESYVDFSFSDSLNFNLIKDPSGKVKSVEFIILSPMDILRLPWCRFISCRIPQPLILHLSADPV